MMLVHVYARVSAQVCRGIRAGRQAHRVPLRSWGEGGVLAGTTPDSNLVECALAVLYIHVTTDKSQQEEPQRRCHRFLHTGRGGGG